MEIKELIKQCITDNANILKENRKKNRFVFEEEESM